MKQDRVETLWRLASGTHEFLEQLQAELDHYLDFYNRERARQGYRTRGRTPWAFLDAAAQINRKEVNPEAA